MERATTDRSTKKLKFPREAKKNPNVVGVESEESGSADSQGEESEARVKEPGLLPLKLHSIALRI